MDSTIATILKQLESFFKRSLLPSSVLIFLLFLFGKVDKDFNVFLQKLNILTSVDNSYQFLAIMLISLVTLSFLMSILTQIIFDNAMKNNFDSEYFYKGENSVLKTLRDKVVVKLKKEENDAFDSTEYTDYFLYQIIGRKLQFFKEKTDTRRYMDDIKSSGIVFLSLIVLFLIQIIAYFEVSIFYFLVVIPFCIFLIFLTRIIANEYIKSKYRSRAFRIYINYLIDEN